MKETNENPKNEDLSVSSEEKDPKPKRGRPTLYKPEYCEMLIDFFNIETTITKKVKIPSKHGAIEVDREESTEIPMLIDFAQMIGVDYDTLLEWRDKYPEFSGAYKKAKMFQEKIIVTNGIKGRYDKTFAIFMLKCNHDWKEKTEVEHSGNIQINIDEDESQL